MLKIDLHLHTSDDPLDNIAYTAHALVARAAELGFGALAVTLHDRQFIDPRLAAYAREREVVLIAGVERTISGKHVLLLNFPRAEAEGVRTLDDLKRLRSRHNGLVVAPHPFFPSDVCLGRLLDQHEALFDAVEWSWFWTRALDFNSPAREWARRHGKSVVGNSDLHDLRQLGRTYSLVDAAPEADAICEAIRSGRVEWRTSPVPPLELALVLGGMAIRTLWGNLDQLYIKHEHPLRLSRRAAIGQVLRNPEPALLPLDHHLHALGPAANHPVERKR